jgi:hypothetical protein
MRHTASPQVRQPCVVREGNTSYEPSVCVP